MQLEARVFAREVSAQTNIQVGLLIVGKSLEWFRNSVHSFVHKSHFTESKLSIKCALCLDNKLGLKLCRRKWVSVHENTHWKNLLTFQNILSFPVPHTLASTFHFANIS